MKHTRLPVFVLTFLWIGLLLLTAGCSSKKNEITSVASASDMAGNWLLIEPASPYRITLQITDVGSSFIEHYGVQLTGQSSVNQYFATGSFSIRPSIESGPTGTGSVSGLGSTKIAGLPAAMQFENDYFARLQAVNKAELAGTNQLRLSYGGTSPGVLVYKRQ
ncbi:META domain-containing protein [Fibrivirga algicola]|uniref:META domain-containing protein n=1 Tax=Fibrivirga algicola TaxID=2950420 RepID=A0ABX0QGS6_9BACT|nr:META domain-containing protein [Fibrivirga algicola]NID11604.1 META domain-containing protein [Fibrivirga algicola]